MANPEHLAILEQGVDEWNQWRKENLKIKPDLRKASFYKADFRGINLSEAELDDADFADANLSKANLIGAHLGGARLNKVDLSEANLRRVTSYLGLNLRDANLSGSKLWWAYFNTSDLSGANLKGAQLHWTSFLGVKFIDASLRNAKVDFTTFSYSDLSNLDLSEAKIGWAIFDDNDLSTVKGLDNVHHVGPSTIGVNTLYKSGGKIPEVFLRGCGVPEQFISYIPSLVGQAIKYYSCFISYSTKDQAFAERLHADLQSKGVRCWFAPDDLKIGDKHRFVIDDSIRLHEKLLLILSENSIASDWVEKEVETAMEKERERKRTVLFPVRLDDAVTAIKSGWAADIRRTRHIGDFSKWKSHDEYRKVFERLLCDLKVEGDRQD